MMNYERTDVVFVVEKSVSMKRYLPELLENYITPTVSCFGSGLSEESDVFFTQSSVVQYASVFFGTELSLIGSWGQVECYGPTCSETEIINSIKNARYTCKNLSRQAFILDGLQASLNMFETMKKSSGGGDNVQKVCVLVTQSTPMSNPWSPTNPEKVLIELKRTKIQLSVVSAHKLVELYRLFDAAGGDLPTPNKNYASKPQHLVLLNGFSLQERAVSPSLMGYTQTGSVATPPAALGNQVTQPGVPVQTTGGPGPSPNPMGPIATAPSPGPGGSPAPPQPGQTQLVRGPGVNPMVVGCNLPNQPNPSMPVGAVLRPSMPIARVINPTRPRWPVEAGGVVGGTVPWQAGPGPRPPGMAVMVNQQPPQTVQGEVIGPKSQPGGGPSQFSDVDASLIGQPQPPLQQVPGGAVGGVGQAGMNPPNQRLVVWQGALEWQEKKADNNSRVVHQVTCKMTSLLVNGEPEVKADHWSQTLIMQMIPKHILGNIGNTFFKNVKTVMFLPDQSHALEILTNFLFRGMAGCVHVSHASAQQGEVKVIILLYSSEKKAYVGFIPIDQFSFVNKIKSVIQSARKGQMTGGMMSQGVSGPGGVPGPGGPHMVVQSSTGLQQLSSNPGAGMNVMPSQSMIIQQNPQLTQALSQPISQAGPTLLAGGQMSQLASGAVSQAMGQQGPGAGSVNVQMAAGPSVLATQLTTRPTLNIQQQQAQQQQQQQQQQPDLLQMRQNQPQQQQQHHTAIRQQLQQQLQQRPGGMNMTGGSTSLNQPRMMQTAMATPSGLKQLLQQQQHVRLQHQQVQQHQQQQQQQQHIIMMQQQQGMRPQMTGQGQQVMGQAIGQQGMPQQSLTQQNMNQQGIGQPLAESNQDYLDLL